MFSIPEESRGQIQRYIENGVFKDFQNFVDTAITRFLSAFDHAKIDPKNNQKSLCKFRVFCESYDDLKANLEEHGVKGNFNVALVDYRKYDRGDILMHHVKRGKPIQVFEVDLLERNSFFNDGEECIYIGGC